MTMALDPSSSLRDYVEALIVADMRPMTFPLSLDFPKFIEAMLSINAQGGVAQRKDADVLLKPTIPVSTFVPIF